MSRRFFVSLSLLATMIAVVSLTAAPAAGQTTAQTDASPRTPWGDPDLQGIWTGSTLTPFERPEDLAGKEFLTQEEVAAIEDEAARNQFVERVPRQETPGPITKSGSTMA